jgi:hypothetical protein
VCFYFSLFCRHSLEYVHTRDEFNIFRVNLARIIKTALCKKRWLITFLIKYGFLYVHNKKKAADKQIKQKSGKISLFSCILRLIWLLNKKERPIDQCSGSVGFVFFWVSWIQIHNLVVGIWLRILPLTSKKNAEKPKFLLFCNFFMTFYLWRKM